MQDTPSITQSAQAPHAAALASRRVIDAPTRMFHWLFALSFLGAYLTADGESWRLLHVTLGYTMAGLLAFRVLYGMFGPRQAGLGLIWRKLASAPDWLRSLTQSGSPAHINWRQGQNLLMALAVVALLLMVVPLTLSGYATYNDWDAFLGGDWLEDMHEFFGEATLMVVGVHLALIAGLSLLRRNNQARPMLTGRVDGKGPDLVTRSRVWLAALLLLAVLAYGVWEWQHSSEGLVSTKAWNNPATSRQHDDD